MYIIMILQILSWRDWQVWQRAPLLCCQEIWWQDGWGIAPSRSTCYRYLGSWFRERVGFHVLFLVQMPLSCSQVKALSFTLPLLLRAVMQSLRKSCVRSLATWKEGQFLITRLITNGECFLTRLVNSVCCPQLASKACWCTHWRRGWCTHLWRAC